MKNYNPTCILCDNKLRPLSSEPWPCQNSEGAANPSDLPTPTVTLSHVRLLTGTVSETNDTGDSRLCRRRWVLFVILATLQFRNSHLEYKKIHHNLYTSATHNMDHVSFGAHSLSRPVHYYNI